MLGKINGDASSASKSSVSAPALWHESSIVNIDRGDVGCDDGSDVVPYDFIVIVHKGA